MLKAIYDNQEDIPEAFRELYSERGGKWELTGVEGVKTAADVERLQSALSKERDEHKEARERLRGFGDLTPDKATELSDKVEDLQAQLEARGESGALDEKKIEELVERRATSRIRPYERQVEQLKGELDKTAEERNRLREVESTRTVLDEAKAATRGLEMTSGADQDWELLARNYLTRDDSGKVVTRDDCPFGAAITARELLESIRQERARPHWFKSQSAGATGSGGDGGAGNPFAGEKPNMTDISKMVRDDPEKAKRLAVAAKRPNLLPPALRPN